MFFIQKAVIFLLFVRCALMSSINSQPIYNYHFCEDQSNNSSDASFESNLTVLLGSLSSKASQNISFYNDTSNGIYGLFPCRVMSTLVPAKAVSAMRLKISQVGVHLIELPSSGSINAC